MSRWIVITMFLLVAACSLANREGRDLSCAALQNGAINACQDGIITSCVAGAVVYKVCEDKDACSAPWQSPGRYGCTSEEAADFKPSSGAEGSSTGGGGTAGSGPLYEACGVTFKQPACGMCIAQTACCQKLTTCVATPLCESCLNRSGAEAKCDPALVPPYEAVVDCLLSTCKEECK